MIEQRLKEHLMYKYGDFTPVRLTGGYTNDTFLLNGTSPLLVVKVSNSFSKDIQNEINCLRLMEKTDVAPKVYDFIKADHLQITVMEYREGTNGQAFIDKGDIEKTKELYKSLGRSLSERIHSRKYPMTATGIKECDLHEVNLNLDFVPENLIQNSKKILETIDDHKKDWVLTHGDYGIHNVLYTDYNLLTVIDWEWSEWANPLTDIAWVYWFTKLHYSEHADLLLSLFIEEYQKYSDIHLSSKKLKAYCLYRVWKVLNKVSSAPQEVQEEWVRRLKWTIKTDFI